MLHSRIKCLLTLVFIVIAAIPSYATHILGGELLYEHISGNNYRVNLVIYGDCSGQQFPSLRNARPTVYLTDDDVTLNALTLSQQGPGVEVSAVCSGQLTNTKCKSPVNTLPGVMRYIYSTDIAITVQSNALRFVFDGEMGAQSQAGRSNAITNLSVGIGSVIYLEAYLDNTDGPNSSPKYNSIPTPYFCINKPQSYNQAAADPDNDSLYFSLTPALTGGNTAQYVSPYTATAPLATAAGTFKYTSINGQMAFTPNATQTSVVVNRVDEYKNGKLVGSSMREMTFIVLGNCNNDPPNTAIGSDVTGGKYAGNNIIYACNNSSGISFSISASDPNGDHVNVTASNVPSAATLNIMYNNTDTPKVFFNWPLTSMSNGIYTFYLDFTDDNCPISSKQTIAYTVVIVSPFTFGYNVLFPTRCYNKAYVNLMVDNGTTPKDITLTYNSSDIIKQFTDTAAKTSITDSLAVGDYEIAISSPNLPCSSLYKFSIVDSGTYPFPPDYDNINACTGDEAMQVPVLTKYNTPVHWYSLEGTKLPGAPIYDTKTPKKYIYLVTQQIKVCESVSDTFRITVHQSPDIEVTDKPLVTCYGDKLLLKAAGADAYKWYPEDKVTQGDDGNYYTKVLQPTSLTVVGSTLYGCSDSATVSYNDIQQCCRFDYPSAFSPNGDGLNDGFRVITFGNTSKFIMYIYNRWGERLFSTNDPKKYWDGTYKGQPCEVGTYYYLVKGTCLTGPSEEKAGEFNLVR